MEIEARRRGNVFIIKPKGKLISGSISEFKKTVLVELDSIPEKPNILFDCADVTRIDSSGFGILMSTHVAAHQLGGRVGIIHVGENIRKLIVRAHLIGTFEYFDSEDEAIAAFDE